MKLDRYVFNTEEETFAKESRLFCLRKKIGLPFFGQKAHPLSILESKWSRTAISTSWWSSKIAWSMEKSFFFSFLKTWLRGFKRMNNVAAISSEGVRWNFVRQRVSACGSELQDARPWDMPTSAQIPAQAQRCSITRRMTSHPFLDLISCQSLPETTTNPTSGPSLRISKHQDYSDLTLLTTDATFLTNAFQLHVAAGKEPLKATFLRVTRVSRLYSWRPGLVMVSW